MANPTKPKDAKPKAENEEFEISDQKHLSALSTINAHVKVLNRLLRERAFSDNSRRVVDMTEIFLTDIIKSDKRYNFCYRFYCDNFKSKKMEKMRINLHFIIENYNISDIIVNIK